MKFVFSGYKDRGSFSILGRGGGGKSSEVNINAWGGGVCIAKHTYTHTCMHTYVHIYTHVDASVKSRQS